MSTTLRRRVRAVLLSAAALSFGAASAPGAAFADEPAPPVFGRSGQLVLPQLVGVRTGTPAYFGMGVVGMSGAGSIANAGWGGALGYAQNTSEYPIPPGVAGEGNVVAHGESFWIAPAADLFVTRNVSIGLAGGVVYSRYWQEVPGQTDAYGNESFSVAVAPRVGYVVPMGRGLSFWPRLTVGASYSEQNVTDPQTGVPSASGRSLSAGLDLAFVYHPHERLMFQVAPQISVGKAISEGYSPSDATWVRLGGEATAGLVF